MSARRILVIAVVLGLAALAYYLSGPPREVCTVCLSYRARVSCATASGRTAATSVERARRKACSQLAAADSVAACLQLPPSSIQCPAA